jgi:hypothetical protein
MTHPRLKSLLERLLILPALVLCIGSPAAFAAAVGGGTYYVSGSGDDGSGDGSEANPWRTITYATGKVSEGLSTIMIGEGTYNEEAGESFPVQLGENSLNFIGPGDGSALIEAEANVFEAFDSLAEYEISGLDFEGMITEGVMPGPSAVFVTTDTEIPPFLKLDNNNVSNMGLAVLDGGEFGVYLVPASVVEITNNTVTNAALGVEIDLGVSMSAFEDTTCLLDFKIEGNQFVGVEKAIEMDFSVWHPLMMKVAITNNQFSSCYYGISSTLDARALSVDVEMLFNDNVFNQVEYGLFLSCSVEEGWPNSEQAVLSRDIQIVGNEIQAGSAIYFTTSVSEGPAVEQNIQIAGNTIVANSNGIYQSFEVSENSAELRLDREFSILNNTIETDSGDGVFLYQEYSSEERGVCDYDLTVDGNTIRGNGGYGLCLSHYLSYTATSVINQTITRNHISESESTGVWLEVNGSTGIIDHNVLVRGNVFEDNGSSSSYGESQAHVAAEAYMSEDATYDLDFDMGSPSAFGYNTIVADDASPSQWSVYFDFDSQSSINANLSVVGNWWGTQDAGVIEDRVYHGVDSSELFTANLSNPLPDSLDFTAEYQAGIGIVATAGADAGFVAYAGDLLLMGAITGPVSGGGPIEASWVSEDYRTVILPVPGDEFLPLGSYEFCLSNPGGQTGCASFTVGDEDCSQNQAPVAVSDNAETDQGVAIVIDLTGNDSDYTDNMDPTAVTITQGPDKGTVVNNGDGTATYTPDPDEEYTTDTFNYTVSDTCGAISNIASCQIFIGHGGGGDDNQHDPGAVYDSAVTEMNAAVTIDILSNDFDPDGDALDTGSVVITQDPAKGSVVVNADGTVTYTPNEGIAGTTDTFNYTVDDEFGGTSNIATVAVSIQYATDGTDITGGVGGNAGGRTTRGARGGLGNGGTPTYGGTRTP